VWETDEGSDVYDYMRLKVENVKKIKNDIRKPLRNKAIKYKKIDEEMFEKLKLRDKYFKNKVYPLIQFKDKMYTEDEDLNRILLGVETYNVEKKPEIGSSLIFEINPDNELKLVDVSKEYYDVTTKHHYYLPAGTFNWKTNSVVSRKRKKKPKKIVRKELVVKSDLPKKITTNKKKRKKNRKLKHTKNSTIIEIKKI
jgi:hypothetical protein